MDSPDKEDNVIESIPGYQRFGFLGLLAAQIGELRNFELLELGVVLADQPFGEVVFLEGWKVRIGIQAGLECPPSSTHGIRRVRILILPCPLSTHPNQTKQRGSVTPTA